MRPPSTTLRLAPLLLVAAVTACRSHATANPPASPPSPTPAPTATSATTAPAPAPLPAATSDAGLGAGATEVDLLHAVPSTVAVSSVVANPTDVPPALADGNPETAWSSRTGELEHTWLAVRLPADASVTGISLTAGYTKQTPAHDLFTTNVRIQRVRVSHGGTVVGEYPLDVNDRGLQRLPVTGTGGDWKLEFVGVLPGSQRGWREVCVSDLRVWGRAGSAPAAPQPATPAYRVGDLDRGASWTDVADDRALEGAVAEMRTALLGGRDPEEGCALDPTGSCVQRAWQSLAQAAVDYARHRCAGQPTLAGPDHAFAEASAAASQANDRFSQAMAAGHGTDRAERAQEDRTEADCHAAAAVLHACAPTAPALGGLAQVLETQLPETLQHYHFHGAAR